MLKIFSRLFALLLAAALAAPAQAAGLVETMRDRYAAAGSFKAAFTQNLTHKESGQKETREGSLQFKKPLLIRWETKEPAAETLVVNEKEIWDHIPEENVAYRYPRELVEDSRSLIQVVTGQALLSKDFDVKDAGTEKGLSVLQLYPREPVPQLVEARLYVDPVKGFIQRAVITDFYGNENDVRFTSFTPDADIPSRVFRFTPPKGTDVEDRVEKPAIEGRNLF